MSNQNRNYLLFIVSDFNKNPFLKDIPIQFRPIITSKYFKYNYGDYGMICNFETDLPFDELREFAHLVLEGLVEQFFIIEHTDNMASYMPDNLKLNLFDLNSDNKNYDTNEILSDNKGKDEGFKIMEFFLKENENTFFDSSDFIKLIFNDNEDDEDDDDEYDSIINKARIRQKTKDIQPSLDELLDKIKEKGIKSLTTYENQILEQYARN